MTDPWMWAENPEEPHVREEGDRMARNNLMIPKKRNKRIGKVEDIERAHGMLRELADDESDTMNDWEAKFVDDMVTRESTGLTTRQLEKIEQIWEKVFG